MAHLFRRKFPDVVDLFLEFLHFLYLFLSQDCLYWFILICILWRFVLLESRRGLLLRINIASVIDHRVFVTIFVEHGVI